MGSFRKNISARMTGALAATFALAFIGCGGKGGVSRPQAGPLGADPAQKAGTTEGGGLGSTSRGSCDIAQEGAHYCVDFVGTGEEQEGLRKACLFVQGEFSSSSCKAGRTSCVVNPGTPDEQVYHFYSGFTPELIKSACSQADTNS